jgi:hypothetical protein
MLVFGGHLALQGANLYILVIWGTNALLLAWKYRRELGQALQPRPWVGNLLRQSH